MALGPPWRNFLRVRPPALLARKEEEQQQGRWRRSRLLGKRSLVRWRPRRGFWRVDLSVPPLLLLLLRLWWHQERRKVWICVKDRWGPLAGHAPPH